MRINLLLLFLSIVNLCHGDAIVQKFTKNFFGEFNVHHVVIFACWDEIDSFKYVRSIMELGTVVSYIKITPTLQNKIEDILQVNYYHIGVFLDFDCPFSNIVLEKFSNQLVFNESYIWLLHTKSSLPMGESLRNLPLTVESELTIAIRDQDTFKMYDVYNPSYRHGGSLNVTYRGQWNSSIGLENKLTQYKYSRRANFNLLTLNFSCALINPPLPNLQTYMSSRDNPHFDTMTRYHFALGQQLQDMFNFTINLNVAKTWGYLVNGTFNGIIGDMLAGKVDISISPFQYKAERLSVCEFTVETWVVKPNFIFRHPIGNSLENHFLQPFTYKLWYAILVVGFIYWLLLLASLKVEIYYGNSNESSGSLVTTPASETGLITMAAISQQGLSDGPSIISGRIIFLSLFIWGLLLYQFYSASIVGSLLAARPRWLNSMDNLTDSSLECALEDVAYHRDYFATSTNPIDSRFWNAKIKPTKKRPNGGYYSAIEGMQKVKNGGFAFHIDPATAYKVIEDTFEEDEICELHEVEMLPPRKVTLVTSKHSPFKKMIIYGLRKIVETGIAHRLRQIWHHQKPKCPESYSSKPSPVPIEQFNPAIFLLIIGIIIAFFIMLLENIFFYYHTSNLNFNDDHEVSSADNQLDDMNDEQIDIDTISG
uniref:Ionotropic receptor n=1 Tax=Aphidius gifuensis TaxID=684658 RepID=A0A3S9LWC3_APHGI|nr:ionotropic receptor [Aphidius gifuensis]